MYVQYTYSYRYAHEIMDRQKIKLLNTYYAFDVMILFYPIFSILYFHEDSKPIGCFSYKKSSSKYNIWWM